jgi:hypothetical protein
MLTSLGFVVLHARGRGGFFYVSSSLWLALSFLDHACQRCLVTILDGWLSTRHGLSGFSSCFAFTTGNNS